MIFQNAFQFYFKRIKGVYLMKKYSYLIVIVLISGLVLAGCELLSNIGQVPSSEQSSITYFMKSTVNSLFSDNFESYDLGTHSGGVNLGDWQYVSGTPSIVLDMVSGVTTQVLGIAGVVMLVK